MFFIMCFVVVAGVVVLFFSYFTFYINFLGYHFVYVQKQRLVYLIHPQCVCVCVFFIFYFMYIYIYTVYIHL